MAFGACSGMGGFLYFLEYGDSPWAETAAQGAGDLLESALGSYSSRLLFDRSLPDEFDASDAVTRVPDNPDVWTDGSLVLDQVSGASSSGSGFYAHLLGQAWGHRRWGHLDDSCPTGRMIDSCRASVL